MSEFDDLLNTLRAEQPRATEIARWKAAVARMHRHKYSRWIELVAAMLIGIVIGSTMMHKSTDERNVVRDATFERVITKIE